MTIDEYLDIQREQGNILSGGANAGEASASASALVDDMDELALDADTLKKRAFDDFKDDNPRGWGNTMVNRG